MSLKKNRSKSIGDVLPIIYGSMPIDDGHLILSDDDVNELLAKNADNSKFIRKYARGAELIQNKDKWYWRLKDVSPKTFFRPQDLIG